MKEEGSPEEEDRWEDEWGPLGYNGIIGILNYDEHEA